MIKRYNNPHKKMTEGAVFNTDWRCSGCHCNHGKRLPKKTAPTGEHYCEQTYYGAMAKAGMAIDKNALASKYAGGANE